MAPRRVIIAVEVETGFALVDIERLVKHRLGPLGRVQQVQVNVIKRKRKGRA